MIIHHGGDLYACFISDIPYNESNLMPIKNCSLTLGIVEVKEKISES